MRLAKTFERALEASPRDPEANYGLGMVFAQADDPERAYEYLQKRVEVSSRLPGSVEQPWNTLFANPPTRRSSRELRRVHPSRARL